MPLSVWLVTVCLKHRILLFLSYFLLCVLCVCAVVHMEGGGKLEWFPFHFYVNSGDWNWDTELAHTAEPSRQRPNLVCPEEQCTSFHTGPC